MQETEIHLGLKYKNINNQRDYHFNLISGDKIMTKMTPKISFQVKIFLPNDLTNSKTFTIIIPKILQKESIL